MDDFDNDGLLAAMLILGTAPVWGSGDHIVQRILLEADRVKPPIVVNCEAIPGYMDAMVMPFEVRDAGGLNKLAPGTTVRFHVSSKGKRNLPSIRKRSR